MVSSQNIARIAFAVKPEIKELIAAAAEQEGIHLLYMYQVLLIAALVERERKKKMFASVS